jgi:hypothetical protein
MDNEFERTSEEGVVAWLQANQVFLLEGSEKNYEDLSQESGGKPSMARKADNFTAICEPIVWTKYVSLDVS